MYAELYTFIYSILFLRLKLLSINLIVKFRMIDSIYMDFVVEIVPSFGVKVS